MLVPEVVQIEAATGAAAGAAAVVVVVAVGYSPCLVVGAEIEILDRADHQPRWTLPSRPQMSYETMTAAAAVDTEVVAYSNVLP